MFRRSIRSGKPTVLTAALVLLMGVLSACSGAFQPLSEQDGRPWEAVPVTPKLPIGMNLAEATYWGPTLLWTNVMNTAEPWVTTYGEWGGVAWDTRVAHLLEYTDTGYPRGIPQLIDGSLNNPPAPGLVEVRVQTLVNNYYRGLYRVDFKGKGRLGGHVYKEGADWFLSLDGSGNHRQLSILESDPADPVRDIQILPAHFPKGGSYSPFYGPLLEALRPFHALRFMDLARTNNQRNDPENGQFLLRRWSERPRKDWYTQATNRGVSNEYLIELCNTLKADAWICIPHGASDDYIRNLARLWKENLHPDLKIYVEFSNEIWNSMFPVGTYIQNGAPEALDDYVRTDLVTKTVHKDTNGQPYFWYQIGYMMARTFRLFEEVFGSHSHRIINVATGQHVFPEAAEYILEYLFDVDGIGAEAYSVAGYFSEDPVLDSARWAGVFPFSAAEIPSGPGELLDQVLDSMYGPRRPGASNGYSLPEATRRSAALARKRNIRFLTYEGGQHLQPLYQSTHAYNPVLWESQIHPKMYQLYLKNFEVHTEPGVDCDLFMAFHLVAARKSQYGSWGHLESFEQLGTNLRITAPKYQALLDANLPR